MSKRKTKPAKRVGNLKVPKGYRIKIGMREETPVYVMPRKVAEMYAKK